MMTIPTNELTVPMDRPRDNNKNDNINVNNNENNNGNGNDNGNGNGMAMLEKAGAKFSRARNLFWLGLSYVQAGVVRTYPLVLLTPASKQVIQPTTCTSTHDAVCRNRWCKEGCSCTCYKSARRSSPLHSLCKMYAATLSEAVHTSSSSLFNNDWIDNPMYSLVLKVLSNAVLDGPMDLLCADDHAGNSHHSKAYIRSHQLVLHAAIYTKHCPLEDLCFLATPR